MYDPELDRFKSDIHFLQYAIERYGYLRDRRKSSRASHVLRHPGNGDKIVVRRESDGHWTYFSLRDDRDNGTILDFVRGRERSRSFGEVCDELRRWLGTARPEAASWASEPKERQRDPRSVAQVFAAAHVASDSPYLRSRGLRPDTLDHPRFAGTWREDSRGNVLFAHHDDAGQLTGFEVKNRGYTRFSTGGTKSAWQSAAEADDRFAVFTESAIDALSHHQLHPDRAARSRYLSTAGARWSPRSTPMTRAARSPPGSRNSRGRTPTSPSRATSRRARKTGMRRCRRLRPRDEHRFAAPRSPRRCTPMPPGLGQAHGDPPRHARSDPRLRPR
jgi:hypothetical protein